MSLIPNAASVFVVYFMPITSASVVISANHCDSDSSGRMPITSHPSDSGLTMQVI
jgi:hypothetical protein